MTEFVIPVDENGDPTVVTERDLPNEVLNCLEVGHDYETTEEGTRDGREFRVWFCNACGDHGAVQI